MKSRFPGVDPYVESQGFWPDFHARFINHWCDHLADRLPENYEARIDERVNLVELPAQKIKRIKPDVSISRREPRAVPAPASGGLATLEAVTIPLVIQEETRETYIEILERPHRTLVAVLELLSPSNKEEPGRASYLTKRNTVLNHPVHLVELDLLAGGRRLPLERDYPPGDCFALVAREERRPDADVYAWSVRQPLPPIPIPLSPPDADVWINLAEVLAVTYERGRYARSIDNAAALNVPLAPNDLTWAQQTAQEEKR